MLNAGIKYNFGVSVFQIKSDLPNFKVSEEKPVLRKNVFILHYITVISCKISERCMRSARGKKCYKANYSPKILYRPFYHRP